MRQTHSQQCHGNLNCAMIPALHLLIMRSKGRLSACINEGLPCSVIALVLLFAIVVVSPIAVRVLLILSWQFPPLAGGKPHWGDRAAVASTSGFPLNAVSCAAVLCWSLLCLILCAGEGRVLVFSLAAGFLWNTGG